MVVHREDVLQQWHIEATVRQRLLAETVFLDASVVAGLLHRMERDHHDTVSSLRRRSRLLAIDVAGRELIPAFQIDAARARVHAVVGDVNGLLHAVTDPWGVLSWWTSPSPRRHDGLSPSDLVGRGQDDVVRSYAEALLTD